MKKISQHIPSLYLFLLLALLCLPIGAWSLQGQTAQGVLQHEVVSGETLYSLARYYGVTTDEIYQLNPSARDGIRIGQVLRIPRTRLQSSATTSSADQGRRLHTISAGETLYGVSKRYGVSEEDIMRSNPSISASHFPQGYPLVIPPSAGGVSSTPMSRTKAQVTEELEQGEGVNVCLILPISEGGRYVEFYEGLLMSLNELKKGGVSVNLDVYDASTEAEVASLIRRGAISDADLIIGGKDEEQVALLAQAKARGVYVSPFIATYDVASPYKLMLHINQPALNVGLSAVEVFGRRYSGKVIYFVGRSSDKADPFAQALRQSLIDEGGRYRTVNLDRETLNVEPNSVIVPISPDASLARQTLKAMQGIKQTTLFGYPQWQSYGQGFLEDLCKWNTTIFSSFFFDTSGEEEKAFILHYNAWFSKKISDTYPKYSVLGYDLGRYLIRSAYLYKTSVPAYDNFLSMATAERIPADGLQMYIAPVATNEEGTVWRNMSFYLVTFQPDGTVTKGIITRAAQ